MDEEIMEETVFKNEASSDVFKNEAAPEETFEEREARLKRQDYERRNLEAIKEREDILRRNKVLAEDEPFSMDPDAAVRQRCCF
jgi:primosomal protein N''